MAIRMTITHRMHPSGFPKEYTEKTFDVDLISYNEMDFPDLDLHAMMAAQAVGMPFYDVPLDFYNDYTKKGGFLWFLSKYSGDFYDALEEQGFDNFNHGAFSRKQLVSTIKAPFKTDFLYRHNYALQAIANSVDFSEEDQGLFSQKEARSILLYALENGKGAAVLVIRLLKPLLPDIEEENLEFENRYIKALVLAYVNNADFFSKDILEELEKYIDEDDIDYTSEPISEGEGEGWEFIKYENELKILGHTLYEWDTLAETRIIDPISFEPEVIDGSNYTKTWRTPKGVVRILNHFKIAIIEPEPPSFDTPVSDEEGEYAVRYTPGPSDHGFPAEEIIIPYKEKFDATEAIELSQTIFSRDFFKPDWTMALLKLVNDKWVQIEPEWQWDDKDEWKQVEED